MRLSRSSSGPAGIAVDYEARRMYVTDAGADKLYQHVFNPECFLPGLFGALGPCVCEAGGFGVADGDLMSPGDICLAHGFIYVAEGNGVSAFRDCGGALEFSHKWGAKGDGPGLFRAVGGLASIREELFVADVKNHRVQCFVGATGEFVRMFGSKGDRAGEFRRPCALGAARGRLLVAELTGRRLQVLSVDGVPLQLLTFTGMDRIGCFCVDEKRGCVYAGEASYKARIRFLQLQ